MPKYKEIIEGFGYPGQRHSAGGLCTIGRIYYGPGRYDYGRVKMPKGWFQNFFYPFWEFGHLMFVADHSTSRCSGTGKCWKSTRPTTSGEQGDLLFSRPHSVCREITEDWALLLPR